MDLSGWIDRHARFTPHACAIRFGAESISYADLAARIDRAAASLHALAVRPGAAVAFLGLNHPAAFILLFACARLGAMFVPLNWRLAPPEIARVLADCPPRALFAEPEYVATATAANGGKAPRALDALDRPGTQAAPHAGDDAAPLLLCYTSGSTGAPKGVVLPQRAILWNAINSAHMHDMTSADRILTTLPLFHVGGLNILSTPALHAGATLFLHPRFDPDATFDAIERERITLTVLVPAQLEAMLASPRWASADLSSLRMISTGSTIVSAEFTRKVHQRGIPVIQVYGSTETCPIAAYTRAADAFRKEGSAGVPALHCELRIVDDTGQDCAIGTDGEIIVRGANVATGYWNAPEATRAAFRDGWYHSGDVGHFDTDGHLYVVSRKKDMIISGGENVYPAEVENVLVQCADIEEVCVFGGADPRWGEKVVAAVVLKAGRRMSAAEVVALCEGRIARYKHPREVRFIERLPRTALGKVRRDDVRAAVMNTDKS